jgi:hypothetical protein
MTIFSGREAMDDEDEDEDDDDVGIGIDVDIDDPSGSRRSSNNRKPHREAQLRRQHSGTTSCVGNHHSTRSSTSSSKRRHLHPSMTSFDDGIKRSPSMAEENGLCAANRMMIDLRNSGSTRLSTVD